MCTWAKQKGQSRHFLRRPTDIFCCPHTPYRARFHERRTNQCCHATDTHYGDRTPTSAMLVGRTCKSEALDKVVQQSKVAKRRGTAGSGTGRDSPVGYRALPVWGVSDMCCVVLWLFLDNLHTLIMAALTNYVKRCGSLTHVQPIRRKRMIWGGTAPKTRLITCAMWKSPGG